jgi:hypothetical protein
MDEELPEHCALKTFYFLILYGEGVISRKVIKRFSSFEFQLQFFRETQLLSCYARVLMKELFNFSAKALRQSLQNSIVVSMVDLLVAIHCL